MSERETSTPVVPKFCIVNRSKNNLIAQSLFNKLKHKGFECKFHITIRLHLNEVIKITSQPSQTMGKIAEM